MNVIESQVFSGELYIKASDHHRAVAAAFEAGKAAAFAQAAHTIGIDTSGGMHTVTVFRMLPGQPTTLVASARLPDATREDIAQLVEAMGMQGYGTLAIAAAIRKGRA